MIELEDKEYYFLVNKKLLDNKKYGGEILVGQYRGDSSIPTFDLCGSDDMSYPDEFIVICKIEKPTGYKIEN